MIPADIDNFIAIKISTFDYYDRYIYVDSLSNYIPKEIGNCISLKKLYLNGNEIVDISPLSNCTLLRILGLSNNQIVDISPLSKCTSLRILGLSNNQIVDMSPLSNCTSLDYLYAQNMNIIKFPHFNKKVMTYY